ncbi:hypothetical protein ACFQ0T_32930 [Kitasatospora gansuensis]
MAGGEFTADGAADRAVQLRALLDGLAVPVAIGLPGASRAEAAAQVASVARALLGG